MPRPNFKIILTKVLLIILCCLLLFGLEYLLALLIAYKSSYKIQDVMIYEGIIIIIIGIFMSMKGSHSGINLQGVGQINENAVQFQNFEVTRLEQEQERKNKEYFKNFYKYAIVETIFSSLVFIIGGILIILIGRIC